MFETAPRDEIVQRLHKAAIAFGRLSSLDDLVHHPQARFLQVRVDGREVELLSPAAVVRGETLEVGPVPDLGAQDEALRREFADPRTTGPAKSRTR